MEIKEYSVSICYVTSESGTMTINAPDVETAEALARHLFAKFYTPKCELVSVLAKEK